MNRDIQPAVRVKIHGEFSDGGIRQRQNPLHPAGGQDAQSRRFIVAAQIEALVEALIPCLDGFGAEQLIQSVQRRKVKDFFIKFKKKLHFADFLTQQTLDFVLHRLFCGLAEMDTDDIGGLANLLSDSRASGGVGCGIVVHSKSSCK